MSIASFYHDLVTHIVPGPQSSSYFVPFIVLPIVLLTPPSILPHRTVCVTFLPLICASTVHAWRTMGGVDVISVNGLLWAFYLLVLKDPRRDFTFLVKSPKGTPGKDDKSKSSKKTVGGVEIREEPYPSTLLPRLPWVGALLLALRLSDWKIKDYSHDRRQPSPPSGKTHFQFIVFAVVRAAIGYIILDISATYIRIDPYFHQLTYPISAPLPAVNGTSSESWMPALLSPMFPILVRTIILAAQAWALISQQFHLPDGVPVLMHWLGLIPDTWSPHLWPPFFGPASSMLTHGLRGFWSTYWHQMMRVPVSGPGFWIAERLGLARRSLGRTAVVMATAFFFSGCVHTGLVPREPLNAGVSAKHIRLLVATFFWVQPVGIIAEHVAANVAMSVLPAGLRKSRSGKAWTALTNALWILVWSCICFPLLGEAGKNLGYFRHYTVPYSIVSGLQRGEWVMWPILR